MPQAIVDMEARVLASLAHPNRLFILDLLQEREMCVCELQAALGLEQSNLSRHLKVMAQEGIVDWHRVGVRAYYRIAEPQVLALRSVASAIVKSRLARAAEMSKSA
ncbi:MAG: ArsR/SmtB family transcription factor [Candidatus Oleimicrobiaceae bacterium]